MKKTLFVLFIGLFTKSYAQTDYTFVYNNDSILKKGVELYDAKQYQESVNEFDRISKLDPKYLNVQYEKALALSALEKKEELKALFEELYSKKLMSEFPNLYTLYGSFLSDQKEYDQSEVIFKEGEKYLPNSSSFLYNFAILYIRKDESQKAVNLLERIITNNPNHSSSHYMLGAIAYDNGKVTEATLAMMSYLIIAPNGVFAKKAIQNLNSKYGENFTSKNKILFSKTGDNFEDIDLILKNQLPLKKVYKVNSEIDDVIIRQIQAVAEYTLEHKMGNVFFETTYIPWIKDMMEKKRFEGYTYYILQSLDGPIGKIINSQKKKISDFNDNYVNGDLWNTYGTRNLDLFGTPQKVVVSIKNHVPYLVGSIINGKSEGRYKYYNQDGNTAGDLNFKNNELDGIQKYFDEKGALTEEKSFKGGKLDGTKTTYYSNGNIRLIENYKDDVLNGISTSYAVNGGKECEVNFVDGKRDGKLICLFSNGSVNSESNYSKEKLNGPYISYNGINSIVESYNYENDLFEGRQLEYYDGKTLKSEVTYAKGKAMGSYKSYYSNGNLEKENFFEDGKIKKIITYFQNGKKSSESFYNNKEELELYSYYDSEENKYFEESYKSGELKSGLQFSRNNSNPVAINLSNRPFVMKDFDGNELASGDFEKGKKSGEWNHHYSSGIKRIQETFTSGKLTGLSKDYEKNGQINGIKNYKDNELNGLYEVYENGKLKRNYCYENGKQLGPHHSFYNDGSLKSESYLVNGKLNFNEIIYWQNGAIYKINTFIDDVLSTVQTNNPKGEKENSFDYKNKTGKFSLKYNNGTRVVTANLINGQLNGQLIEKDVLDNIATSEFINGIRWNSYKDYSPLGTLYRESTYYNGSLNGIDKVYDMLGNLRYTTNNTFGVENGISTRYYHNKSKMNEFQLSDGAIEGESTYYNLKGEAILKIGYLNNHINYYITKSKTGDWSDKVAIQNETTNIVSSYPTGKIAIQINFVKGNLEGNLLVNNELGKPEYDVNYINNNLNGNRTEYYANGNIYKKEKFINNDFDGLQEYFKEDGKPWLTAEYKNDELHGNVLIYTNGKVSITKKYDSNELVEIIK